MNKPVFGPGTILLPKEGTDLTRWATLACDQFTSQPEYWQRADEVVGDTPSTLRIILPEVYLEEPGAEARIEAIHTAMDAYLADVLTRRVEGFVYVERHLACGVRQGLVGCVDLEAYDYEKGATPRIRPSENTVVERIPPRLAVRRGAKVESPHILMLCDDVEETVIEPIGAKKDSLTPLYDTRLMLDGGRIQGWAVTDKADIDGVLAALATLEEEAGFNARYGAQGKTPPFALAVGDGNHSLATAKASWEELKKTLPPEELENHPARYCLVELENVQCPANVIEPIHRVVFGVSGDDVMRAIGTWARQNGARLAGEGAPQWFTLVYGKDDKAPIYLEDAPHPLTVGTVEAILDVCQQQNSDARVDYIHGEDSVEELVAAGDAVGILLPPFEKADLFRGVALGGVLPKKTFSMGHATEKRYYLECRQIL